MPGPPIDSSAGVLKDFFLIHISYQWPFFCGDDGRDSLRIVKTGNLKILVDGWIAWIMCQHGLSA